MSERPAWRRTTIMVDFLLVFAFASVLILPLYKYKYLDKWASIESTFISDARFLKENWPSPRWQPLWYGGTRFDYVYPPALRYGTAVLAKYYPRMTEARAYHIYIAFFYSLGIGGVYLLVRLMSRSRGAAYLAAIGTALTSPSFLFIADIRHDSWLWHPQRLGALVRYGEGPHISALGCIPLALAATWLALEEFRPAWLAAAAVMCALVVSNNFYGATALAIFFPVLTWSVWITRRDRTVWLRAGAIAILSYGLTASWLVPSYIRITTENLRLVAQPGNNWSRLLALAVIAAYLAASARWARGRVDRQYRVFVTGILLLFTLNVLGHHYFRFRVTGEPLRHVPELDMVLIIAWAECLRLLWLRTTFRVASRIAATMIVIATLATSYRYVTQ
ncbi:MAG: hypothetical protein ABIZ80_06585, partial [Bryobacteraceae bacterium]